MLFRSVVKFPEVEDRVPADRGETCIVLEPANFADEAVMLLEHIVDRVFGCVELKHCDVIIVLASKQMATI